MNQYVINYTAAVETGCDCWPIGFYEPTKETVPIRVDKDGHAHFSFKELQLFTAWVLDAKPKKGYATLTRSRLWSFDSERSMLVVELFEYVCWPTLTFQYELPCKLINNQYIVQLGALSV